MPILPDEVTSLDGLDLLDREDLIAMVKRMVNGGVSLSFNGKRTAMEITRKVRPRVTRRIRDLHVGSPEDQCKNLLIEGENLQAMVTLYKYRGQVDLIVTDPPYNTGQYFRYNDRWDEDPNDPELGNLVTMEDGSRHTKWMKTMLPRLQMMQAMLKPQGVIAICIDDNELFHLGQMMDEVFGEGNRLAIINWQKTTPKNDAGHVSVTTEYVLVYAKDRTLARTSQLERGAKSNVRFGNVDGDLISAWKQDNLTARSGSATGRYALQSPFTGQFHHSENRFWAYKRSKMKAWLEEWGSEYQDAEIGDGRGKALVLKGWTPELSAKVVAKSAAAARKRLEVGNWPFLYWGMDGLQKPVRKTHELLVKTGAVPTSFWIDPDEQPLELGTVSWLSAQSGRSRDGIEELSNIVGKDHKSETVKPLKLLKKVI
jgi:adenine-specific DNA-methyltransferase